MHLAILTLLCKVKKVLQHVVYANILYGTGTLGLANFRYIYICKPSQFSLYAKHPIASLATPSTGLLHPVNCFPTRLSQRMQVDHVSLYHITFHDERIKDKLRRLKLGKPPVPQIHFPVKPKLNHIRHQPHRSNS